MITDTDEINKVLQSNEFEEFDIDELKIEKDLEKKFEIYVAGVAAESYSTTTCCLGGCGTSSVAAGCNPPQ
jgi:hypothetical protein